MIGVILLQCCNNTYEITILLYYCDTVLTTMRLHILYFCNNYGNVSQLRCEGGAGPMGGRGETSIFLYSNWW